MDSKYTITFRDPIAKQFRTIPRSSVNGRIAASGNKAAIRRMCEESAREEAIWAIRSDKYVQQDILTRAAQSKGNTLRWRNVHSPRYFD